MRPVDGKADYLTAVRAADRLSRDGFARLAALGERRVFGVGEQLMHQGDAAASLFVILEGSVTVLREHPHLSRPVPLADLGPGEIVGEMGLLDGEPRSATVTALEATVAIEVAEAAVRRCVAADPDLYGRLLRVLSRRLRSTNDVVAQMRAAEEIGDAAAQERDQ